MNQFRKTGFRLLACAAVTTFDVLLSGVWLEAGSSVFVQSLPSLSRLLLFHTWSPTWSTGIFMGGISWGLIPIPVLLHGPITDQPQGYYVVSYERFDSPYAFVQHTVNDYRSFYHIPSTDSIELRNISMSFQRSLEMNIRRRFR